ncbi:hypothetical protein QO001_002708 [Methylobacterium brachiatum]|jgi:hypothetical protein|uniref:Uncharacterized protein n=1 Tax=Methylobacterium brachiatum TaxID=269660 RepID=A0AAJ1WUM0_9HYPH|nr:hypothetical protein [Methylobacterium brachiatum]MCB4803059.1 hypothetical protein [Methylobacterium brachiatum]MDQ0543779.1 hypothetical protein [Methylobacterium brachiatum]
MNPTVKAVLLNERAGIQSAIAAREGTVSDLLVQLNGVENDIRRLRHRLIDLDAFLVSQRVELPEDAPPPDAPTLPAQKGPPALPACKPLDDFVRHRSGKRKLLADAASGRVDAVRRSG